MEADFLGGDGGLLIFIRSSENPNLNAKRAAKQARATKILNGRRCSGDAQPNPAGLAARKISKNRLLAVRHHQCNGATGSGGVRFCLDPGDPGHPR
jgi:hypothetical protein